MTRSARGVGRLFPSIGWLLAAVSLWFAAYAIDRTTEVEVYSDGGKVSLRVADTTLIAPIAVHELDSIEICAMDSVDPPGGSFIEVSGEGGRALDARLPRRFDYPRGEIVPVGDWYLDEAAGEGVVWRQDIGISGPFSVRAQFRGRNLHDLELVFSGKPTTSVAFRRGLINNDLFIRDAAGITRAATSLDPTPAADAGAALALIARGGAIAALLIAIFAAIASASFRQEDGPGVYRTPFATWIAILLAAAALSISAWLAAVVLEGLPHLPDSVVYLLQARWLTDGAPWGEASAFGHGPTMPYVYVQAGRSLAHYPFGWPFLLAAGVAIGLPWLVAPLLGAGFVLLLYLTGKEIDGPGLGLSAAILGLISPMARLMFGSMLSHAAAATLLLAAAWLIFLARRKKSYVTSLAAGVALGWAFGIRPLTSVAVAFPLAVFWVFTVFREHDRRHARQHLIAFVGGGVAAVSPTLFINHLVTGSAFAFPYTLAKGSMYFPANIPFGLRNFDAILASASAGVFGWGWDLIHGPAGLALAIAFVFIPFLLRRHQPTDFLLMAIIASVAIAHLGTRGHGLHGFGARYYFEVFAFFYLLTARGFRELAQITSGTRGIKTKAPQVLAVTLFLALNLSAAAVLPRRLQLYQGYNGVDGSLEQQIVATGLRRALIVLPADDWRGWAMAARLLPADWNAGLLFTQGDFDDPRIVEGAGDRPILTWRDGFLSAADTGGEDPR